MIQFQVRRVLADADLGTPTGRDKALEEARGLIAATPERTAMRDELVREVADRLDVPADYVRGRAPARAAARLGAAGRRLGGEVAFRAEREFLTFCLASGELGRATCRARPTSSSRRTTVRQARATSRALRRPARRAVRGRPGAGAFVTDVARRAGAVRQPESYLQMSILQLEGAASSARSGAPPRRATTRGRPSWPRPSSASREELGQVMGQTA